MEKIKTKELKVVQELKENKTVEIKIMPKIKDRFWKQKLSKTMANLLGAKVLYKPYRTSRRIVGVYANSNDDYAQKFICIFLDLASATPFSKISMCLEEIQKNLEKENFNCLKIQCFYWSSGVKTISLDSTKLLTKKIEVEYVEATKTHLDAFILESNHNADLFIIITDKNNSSDITTLDENDLFYKNHKNKFIFCFVVQGLEDKKLEIDHKIEKNSIVVYD